VAARQGDRLVTAFHPELTGDRRFHASFVDGLRRRRERREEERAKGRLRVRAQ
jgi:5'-phosphate synthase pdxT subunit